MSELFGKSLGLWYFARLPWKRTQFWIESIKKWTRLKRVKNFLVSSISCYRRTYRMRRRLYWCVTPNGAKDYWVVAQSWKTAAEFFSYSTGYEIYEIGVRFICRLPDEPVDMALYDEYAADYPPVEHLEAWGVRYYPAFHVFRYQGKIYRPEADVRRLMHINADVRSRLRRLKAKRAG